MSIYSLDEDEKYCRSQAKILLEYYPLKYIKYRIKDSYNEKKKSYPKNSLGILRWVWNFLLSQSCRLEQQRSDLEDMLEETKNYAYYRNKFDDIRSISYDIGTINNKLKKLMSDLDFINDLIYMVENNQKIE